MAAERVPVLEQDFLDEDPPIRGQKYVCLSFISPEEVLKSKDAFLLSRYLAAVSDNLTELFASLKLKYPADAGLIDTVRENHDYVGSADKLQQHFDFFKAKNSEALEKEFHEANQFRTTIRGIKVRGTYETYPEAQRRSEVLKGKGDKFDIFVAQVGCWCPWSPYPDDIKDQQFAETELNTLMKKYTENVENRDQFYEQRKSEKLKDARHRTSNVPVTLGDQVQNMSLEAPSPWEQRKLQ